jgi:hypothetical protein
MTLVDPPPPKVARLSDLKKEAKRLRDEEGVTYCQGLDLVARRQGHRSWHDLLWDRRRKGDKVVMPNGTRVSFDEPTEDEKLKGMKTP